MSLANSCLSCGAPLGKGAYKCRCGWTATQSDAPVHVDCFNAPQCTKPARISTDRYGIKGQFMNLCLDCDAEMHWQKAKKFCIDHGLVTIDDKRAFCKRLSGGIFKSIDRVPGEDDELAA